MRKKLIALVTLVCMVCCALYLAACDRNNVVAATGISLDLTEVTLTEGEDIILTATVEPADATDISMEWTTSNPSVATVDDGSVIAVSEGEAIITVSTNNGKTATCTVTVEAKEPEPVQQYTVTFYANRGQFANGKDNYALDVNDGEKITPPTVTRSGDYVLAGWFTDESCTKSWNFNDYPVNDDVNLYAGWQYINAYQSVITALEARIKAERNDDGSKVEILLVFTDNDGYLCFVEKDNTGVFSYKTDICGFDEVKGNAELVAQIPSAALTQIKDYNDDYTTDSDFYTANYMAYRYTDAMDGEDCIIYSCVSEWEEDDEHFTTNGPWYSCEVRAIIMDEKGDIFDCSFRVITGIRSFKYVINGTALSEGYNMVRNKLGETAKDFYAERLKEKEA